MENIGIEDVINLDDSIQNTHSITTEPNKTLLAVCPICLEELTTKLKPMSTRCGHVYCSDCLKATLKAKKICPTCQNSISEKTCIRLYI